MTDRFEESVRQAAQDLGAGASAGMPGYEGAWRRGRRRRAIKQGGLALAGAMIVMVALGVNAGRLGNSSTDVDDVAIAVAAATAEPVQTPPATTPPIALVPPSAESLQEPPVAPPEASAAAPTEPTEPPVEAAVEPPAPIAPEPTSPPAAAAAESGPAPTAIPTATNAPVPTATPTTEPTEDATTQAPDPTPEETTAFDDPATTAAGTGEAPTPTAERTVNGPDSTLPIAPARAADAVVIGENAPGRVACDSDGDAKADATCELLPDYACLSAADLRPGYAVADNNEDGAVDTCRAQVRTTCDSVGDGRPDVPCIITPNDAPTDDPVQPPADE